MTQPLGEPRPIETAPKDETRVLLWNNARGEHIAPVWEWTVGRWSDFWSDPPGWCVPDEQCGGWVPTDATHWHPLPAPPAEVQP